MADVRLGPALPGTQRHRGAVTGAGETTMAIVTILYYILVGYVSVLLIWSLLKSAKWERDVLYILVLIPFLLRLFRLK